MYVCICQPHNAFVFVIVTHLCSSSSEPRLFVYVFPFVPIVPFVPLTEFLLAVAEGKIRVLRQTGAGIQSGTKVWQAVPLQKRNSHVFSRLYTPPP